jgi:dolichol-phosphate mannosyltransferase
MISVIVPVFNEEKNVENVLTATNSVLEKIGKKYEIIFVDDGSTDNTSRILLDKAGDNECIKVIILSRNFGQQSAYTAGMRTATGDVLVLMDGDLQDPPELIPEFLLKIEAGYDVVYAVRKSRQESILKKISYFIFYRLLRIIVPFPLPIDSGDFGAVTRRVADQMNEMPEKNRYLRGLRSYVGFNQVAVPYSRKIRSAGKPKYGLFKLLGLASDGIFGFSLVPLRLASLLGFTISTLAILYGIKVVIWRFTSNDDLPGWATLATALSFLGGLQLLFMGIIGEYIGRIFAQVTSRPEYIIKDSANLK